jgi:hypothetical protein
MAIAMVKRIFLLPIALVIAAGCLSAGQTAWLGTPTPIVPGVDLYTSTDTSLVTPAGPIAIFLLRLDPDRVRLESALSNDEVMEAERVDAIAARQHAIAAVNGGFFNTKNGEPIGLLKVSGELVSDVKLTRGVVAILSPPGERQRLVFDQASVRMQLAFATPAGPVVVPIDGVDTTRERGKLMLYTPAYHADTDTAANGTEWVLDGDPLQVVEVRRDLGHTPIPRHGAVLSFGGVDPPPPLDALTPGIAVTLGTTWTSLNGLPPQTFEEAQDVVNGAGLLRRDGATLSNWLATEELQSATFTDVRHPRTVIGVDGRGFIWLAAVDGRQPDHSVGMTFAELLVLCDRLGLRDALNLDGGGSTTMVVQGRIVNRPSDATGPRPVSDAILVKAR